MYYYKLASRFGRKCLLWLHLLLATILPAPVSECVSASPDLRSAAAHLTPGPRTDNILTRYRLTTCNGSNRYNIGIDYVVQYNTICTYGQL